MIRRYCQQCAASPLLVVKEEVSVNGAALQTYELSCSPVQDKRRRVIGRLFLFHEVSDRKLMEQALRASEEHFRQMFEHAPIAMTVLQQGKS